MDLPADAGKTLDYFATSVWRPELRGGLRSEYCVVGEGTVRPLERLVWELD